MATYYVKSGAGAAEFAQSTVYSSGNKIVPKRSDVGTNFLLAKRYVWECTTGGTSAGAEPTWPAAVTADSTTVTSNTAVFTARKPGFSSGSTANWAFATIYLDYVGALAVAGDTVYISNNHAESVGSAIGGGTLTLTSALVTGVNYICVSDAATPPTTLATSATVTTTGAFNINVGTVNTYVYGVTFICGATDNATRLLTPGGFFDTCSFQLATTGGSSTIVTTGTWKNCTVKFAAAGQAISSSNGSFLWSVGSLLSGGTSPTALATTASVALYEDIDLSNASAGINLLAVAGSVPTVIFRRIKLPASWSGVINSGVPSGAAFTEMSSGDNAGTNYQYRCKRSGGEAFSDIATYRTGGASDGVTPMSHKLVATSLAQFPAINCSTPEIVKKNTVTGSAINVTVELIHDSLTALTDKECWMEIHYYSATGSPLGAVATSAPGFMTAASNLTSSSEGWTNSMSNPNKRKITVSFTPQLKGYFAAKVFLAKASTTAYVCPKLSVT